MKITIKPVTSWSRVLDAARYTAHKEPLNKEPSNAWKLRMLHAQHSPIRLREYDITIEGIPYWVMVHIVRHKVGVEFFVQTSRDDRNNNPVPRAEMPQGALINMKMCINAQALITMAGKRLCKKASKETRKVMSAIRNEMFNVDPQMAMSMKPQCYLMNGCTELQSCGWYEKQMKKSNENETAGN